MKRSAAKKKCSSPFGVSFCTVQIQKIKKLNYVTSGPTFRPLEVLNSYLASADVSPIRSQLKRSQENASGRTLMVDNGWLLSGTCQNITARETGVLFRALRSSETLHCQLSSDKHSDVAGHC